MSLLFENFDFVEIVESGDCEIVVGSVTGSQGRMRSSVEAWNSRKIGMGSKILREMIHTRDQMEP